MPGERVSNNIFACADESAARQHSLIMRIRRTSSRGRVWFITGSTLGSQQGLMIKSPSSIQIFLFGNNNSWIFLAEIGNLLHWLCTTTAARAMNRTVDLELSHFRSRNVYTVCIVPPHSQQDISLSYLYLRQAFKSMFYRFGGGILCVHTFLEGRVVK